MNYVNIKELARCCVEEYKKSANTEYSNYVSTLYVSIDRYDETECSYTSHILNDAEKCLLIHTKQELAISNWYKWYSATFINDEGCVLGNNLGNGFKIDISPLGAYSNQVMSLMFENVTLFSCSPPWEDSMGKLWSIYQRAKKCESKKSIELFAEIIEKDETILELQNEIKDFKFSNYILEKQNKQYKNLLKEIKELVEKK